MTSPRAPLPSNHLGLRWGFQDASADVAELVSRCEVFDSIDPRNPSWAVKRHFTPGATSVVLTGWDASGTARAAASVLWEPGEHPNTAALRAHIDPRWRGRGIGRAVLAWQDATAIDVLSDAQVRRIGITIPSHLVDRRRLYTAAGFSSCGRIQEYSVDLASLPVTSSSPQCEIRSLAELATDAALRVPRSPLDFLATALRAEELLQSADRMASHVSLRDGQVVGAVLAHWTDDALGNRIGFVHDFLQHDPADPALLYATLRGLRDRGYRTAIVRLTPESLASWEQAVLTAGGTPAGSHVVYSIEWP